MVTIYDIYPKDNPTLHRRKNIIWHDNLRVDRDLEETLISGLIFPIDFSQIIQYFFFFFFVIFIMPYKYWIDFNINVLGQLKKVQNINS